MRGSRFIWICITLVAGQVLIGNFLNLSQFVLLTFLPAIILCLPQSVGTPWALGIAFALGVVVDFFSGSVLGPTCVALLPVALLRFPLLRLVFGSEMFDRRENLSVKRHGLPGLLLVMLAANALFLLVYIIVDSAGTRPFWFNLVRFLVSLVLAVIVSLPLMSLLLDPENN